MDNKPLPPHSRRTLPERGTLDKSRSDYTPSWRHTYHPVPRLGGHYGLTGKETR